MRLLHVTHQYPPALGGSERYIADLSEELAARGHTVDVFTSRAVDYRTWRNELPAFEQRNGVKVYRFRSLQRRDYVWRALHFGLRNYWRTHSRWYEPFIFFGGGPLCPGLWAEILRRGRQYDVIHLNCLVYSHVAYGYWAARLIGVPAVVTPHAHAEQETTYNIGYQRQVLSGCARVMAVTAAEREFLIGLGLDPQRVCISGNGLRPECYPTGDTLTARQQLDLPQDAFIILFLGRKDSYKGIEIAARAFAELHRLYPQLFFLAVGPETDDSRAMWPRYQGLENLRVLGAVSDEDKLAALQACDCLVLPSVGEAFGIVFLEAWIMGKPVIGARMLAVQAVIDEGYDGLLAAPQDVADLAGCIAVLIEHPDLGRTMGQRGRAKVLNRYTVSRIADRVENVYERVIQTVPFTSAPRDRLPDRAGAVPASDRRSEVCSMTDTDVIEIHDPNLDQAAIRQRVRTQVAQRMAAGGYGLDPAAPGFGRPYSTGGAVTSLDFPGIDQLLSDLTVNCALREPHFTSNVPLIGPVIVLFRRAWNWMSTRWYVLPLMWQQTAINQRTSQVIHELAQWNEINTQRVAELEARVEELEQRLAKYEDH